MLEDGEEEQESDDAQTGILGAVESVLTGFGKVTEDPITNSLIVVDVPIQFAVIDKIISELDIPPVKILIEVEMMDVSKAHLDQIGMNFENGAYAALTPGSRETRFPWDNRFFHSGSDDTGGEEPSLSTLDLSDFTFRVSFQVSILSLSRFNAILCVFSFCVTSSAMTIIPPLDRGIFLHFKKINTPSIVISSIISSFHRFQSFLSKLQNLRWRFVGGSMLNPPYLLFQIVKNLIVKFPTGPSKVT